MLVFFILMVSLGVNAESYVCREQDSAWSFGLDFIESIDGESVYRLTALEEQEIVLADKQTGFSEYGRSHEGVFYGVLFEKNISNHWTRVEYHRIHEHHWIRVIRNGNVTEMGCEKISNLVRQHNKDFKNHKVNERRPASLSTFID